MRNFYRIKFVDVVRGRGRGRERGRRTGWVAEVLIRYDTLRLRVIVSIYSKKKYEVGSSMRGDVQTKGFPCVPLHHGFHC